MNRLFCPMLSIPLTSHMLPTTAVWIPPPACFSVPKSSGQHKLWLAGTCLHASWPANVHKGMGWMATSRLTKAELCLHSHQEQMLLRLLFSYVDKWFNQMFGNGTTLSPVSLC